MAMLKRLTHPNVVSFLGCGEGSSNEKQSVFHILMEYERASRVMLFFPSLF
jgi:hypothetical protein